MKTDLYIGKYLSFHLTTFCRMWEFHVLPFFDIGWDRILCGWLCFTMQISFIPNKREDYD